MLITAVQNNKDYATYQIVSHIDQNMIQSMQDKFKFYKGKDVILNDSFDDSHWVLCNDYSKINLYFLGIHDFSELISNEFHTSVEDFRIYFKVYTMILVGSYQLNSIKFRLLQLHSFFLMWSEGDIKYALSKNQNKDPCFYTYLYDFLKLINYENEEVFSLLDNIRNNFKTHWGQRELSPAISYLRFGSLLTDFQDGLSDDLFVTYFPIIMWWEITTILPLRPIEFILTPKDCISQNESRYYLKIRRTQLKKGNRIVYYNLDADFKTVEYRITGELWLKISRYLSLTEKYAERKFLFVTSIGSFFSQQTLLHRLNMFYRDIVSQRYNLVDRNKTDLLDNEITKIRLGDTRHLSMISLILQGGNPSICKSLADHDSIDMSSFYYSNVSSVVSSLSYELYRKTTTERKKQGKTNVSLTPLRMTSTDVGSGLCFSPAYQNGSISDCLNLIEDGAIAGDCSKCKYFRSYKNSIFTVTDEEQIIANKLDDSVLYLKEIIKAMAAHKISDNGYYDAAMNNFNFNLKQYLAYLLKKYKEDEGIYGA